MMKQALATVAMILCCTAVFSQTDEKGIILGLERSTADAFSKRDLVFLTAVFADNINVIAATGEIITKQQLLQTVPNIYTVTVGDMKVRIEGYTAIVTGTETVAGKDNNSNANSNKMRFTDVLLKTKGQWQIIARQETAMP